MMALFCLLALVAMESLRLDKASQLTEPSHSPNTARSSTNPWPQVPHLQQHWAVRASPEWSLEHLTQMPAGASVGCCIS